MGQIAEGVAKVGQSVLSAYGMKEQAKENRRQAEARNVQAQFEAQQMEQDAGQVIAYSQRQAAEEGRQATLVASRALAVAAASGGGASDSTVVNLIARVKGEGAYREAARLFAGASQSRKMVIQAATTRYEGAQGVLTSAREQKVTNTMAFLNMAGGFGSMAGKYGGGSPGGLKSSGDFGGNNGWAGGNGSPGGGTAFT